MASHFSVNGTDIKTPDSFKIERYNVTNMERLANAEMVGDLIAKKRKFFFTWDAISGADLNSILQAIWDTSSIFYTLSYKENGVTKTATVYSGSMPSELYRAGNSSNWVWKGVSIDFIEK